MSETGPSGPLRSALESVGGSMSSLTVLSPQNDPFRCDTPSGHRDGRWLRDTLDRLLVHGRRHLRGLHCVLIGQPKPNDLPYTNTDADWQWLASAAKAARWLLYIPFDRIVDRLDEKRAEIREILDTVRVDAARFDLPDPVVPAATLDDDRTPGLPLCDSRWEFADQCRRLRASKNYDGVTGGGVQ